MMELLDKIDWKLILNEIKVKDTLIGHTGLLSKKILKRILNIEFL